MRIELSLQEELPSTGVLLLQRSILLVVLYYSIFMVQLYSELQNNVSPFKKEPLMCFWCLFVFPAACALLIPVLVCLVLFVLLLHTPLSQRDTTLRCDVYNILGVS